MTLKLVDDVATALKTFLRKANMESEYRTGFVALLMGNTKMVSQAYMSSVYNISFRLIQCQ